MLEPFYLSYQFIEGAPMNALRERTLPNVCGNKKCCKSVSQFYCFRSVCLFVSVKCEFVFVLIPVDCVQHSTALHPTHLQFIRTNLGVWIALDNDFGKLSKLEWRNIVVQSFNGRIHPMAIPFQPIQRSDNWRWIGKLFQLFSLDCLVDILQIVAFTIFC